MTSRYRSLLMVTFQSAFVRVWCCCGNCCPGCLLIWSTPIWKSPLLMMSVLSRSWTGLAEALTRSFLSYVTRRCTKLSCISRREVSMWKVGVRVVLVEDPLLPGEFGLYSWTSTIHEGPSLMADLKTGRCLAVVSSCGWNVWLEIDGIYVPYPPHILIFQKSKIETKRRSNEKRLFHVQFSCIPLRILNLRERNNMTLGSRIVTSVVSSQKRKDPYVMTQTQFFVMICSLISGSKLKTLLRSIFQIVLFLVVVSFQFVRLLVVLLSVYRGTFPRLPVTSILLLECLKGYRWRLAQMLPAYIYIHTSYTAYTRECRIHFVYRATRALEYLAA